MGSNKERDMGEWQDISTAPRDGTWVLACIRGFVPGVVQWCDKRGHWSEFEYGDAPEGDDTEVDWQLTHWMPLPPPPAAE